MKTYTIFGMLTINNILKGITIWVVILFGSGFSPLSSQDLSTKSSTPIMTDVKKAILTDHENGINNQCINALRFCTDIEYYFPAGVDAGFAEPGPNYGCLLDQPNPAWYYMKVLIPGDIIIFMSSEPSVDIDFALWGPFDDHQAPCSDGLTADCINCPDNTVNPHFYPSGNLVDCSFDRDSIETAHIRDAKAGEVYILLITNFSNTACNIIISQINAGMPGSGSAYCNIEAPPVNNNGPLCEGDTLLLTAMDGPENSTYFWTGPNNFQSFLQNPSIPDVKQEHAGDYNLRIILYADTSDIQTTNVEIFTAPTASFSSSADDIVIGDYVSFAFTGIAGDAATFLWEFEGGMPSVANTIGPHQVTWSSLGQFEVSLTVTENVCKSIPYAISITSNEKIIIPNAFRPASNITENQTFKPIFQLQPTSYSLQIFNRWGTELFSSENPYEGWDGTWNNQDIPQGSYMVRLRYTSFSREEREYHGVVMLIR